MIDLKNFKAINDSLSHGAGDTCLIEYAKILNKNFQNSLVIRLHGDEFALLTSYDEEKIRTTFRICIDQILLAAKEKRIPLIFGFNAGCKKAEVDFEKTKEQADTMMYYAKNKDSFFERFNPNIFQRKIKRENFVNFVNNAIKNDNFSYAYRKLYLPNKQESNIIQVYTKNKNGNSIFGKTGYDVLRGTSELIKFDIHNIEKLTSVNLPDKKVIITIDSKTLLLTPNFLKIISIIKASQISFENIILNINLTGISNLKYESMIEIILELKRLGFHVCLDKYDATIGDILWENGDIEYIKLASQYWKNAMHRKELKKILEYKILMYKELKIRTICDLVEHEEEHDFLTSISSDDILLSGNYYSEEERLIL